MIKRVTYPTLGEVEKADRLLLCKWYRILPSPETEAQVEVMDRIVARWREAGGFTPQISKAIGFQ